MTPTQLPSWVDRRDERPSTTNLVTHLERLAATSSHTATDRPIDTSGAVAAAGLRLAIVARETVEADAAHALRLVHRTARTGSALEAFRALALARADDAALRRNLQELRHDDDERNRLGRITTWVAPILVAILGASFLLNEVPFMYSTARVQFDIPTSVAPFDLTDPANALAIGLSIIVPTVLFAAIGVGSRTLGWLLYPPVADRWASLNGPDLTPHSAGRRHIPTRAYLWGSLLTIAIVSTILHRLAVMRFEGILFGSSAGAATVYIWLITLLPAAMLVVATAAENPSFVHHRKLTLTRIRRAVEANVLVNHEWRLGRRYEREYLETRRALCRLDDAVTAAAWRADQEYLDAASLTGLLPTPAGRCDADERAGSQPGGRPGSRYLLDVPDPSGTLTSARAQFDALPAPSTAMPLARQWSQLTSSPHGYRPPPVQALTARPALPRAPRSAGTRRGGAHQARALKAARHRLTAQPREHTADRHDPR